MIPRPTGNPRPETLPSSESPSASPMLMPAPDGGGEADEKRCEGGLCVNSAVANSGASVETEPVH